MLPLCISNYSWLDTYYVHVIELKQWWSLIVIWENGLHWPGHVTVHTFVACDISGGGGGAFELTLCSSLYINFLCHIIYGQ